MRLLNEQTGLPSRKPNENCCFPLEEPIMIEIVFAFTRKHGEGNPAGVVPDAAGLSVDEMQEIVDRRWRFLEAIAGI